MFEDLGYLDFHFKENMTFSFWRVCVFDHFEPFSLFDIFKVLRHYLTLLTFMIWYIFWHYVTIFEFFLTLCDNFRKLSSFFFLKWGQNDFDLSLSFLQVCKNDVQILRFVTNLVLIYVANLVLNFSTNFELNFISNRTAIGWRI